MKNSFRKECNFSAKMRHYLEIDDDNDNTNGHVLLPNQNAQLTDANECRKLITKKKHTQKKKRKLVTKTTTTKTHNHVEHNIFT